MPNDVSIEIYEARVARLQAEVDRLREALEQTSRTLQLRGLPLANIVVALSIANDALFIWR